MGWGRPASVGSLLSCLVLSSLSSSLCSLYLLSLSCLSSFSVCLRVWCGVCRVVWRPGEHRVWVRDASVCAIENVPMCKQHAHMLFSMWAWCRYTRGRFECTHGKRLESTQGGHRQFCLTRTTHVRSPLGPTGSPKVTYGCCPCSSLRKDREQHVSDSSNHSLCLIKLLSNSFCGETLEGTSRELVRFVFRSLSEITNNLRVSIC